MPAHQSPVNPTHEPVLARLIRIGLWTTTTIPLIVVPATLSPFHFGKVIIFRSLIEVLFALYLILIWQSSAYRPRLTRVGWAFAAVTAAYAITTLASASVYQSFWGTLERMGGLLSFLHYFLYFLMLTGVMCQRRHWFVLLDLIIGVAVLSAIYAFLQLTLLPFARAPDGVLRPFGTLGNPALFAGYQLFATFLAATLALRPGLAPPRRWLYRGAAAFTATMILTTAVRGSALGLGVGGLVLLLLYGMVYRSRRAAAITIGLGVVVVVLIALASQLQDSALVHRTPYLARISDLSPHTLTAQFRLSAWHAGLKGWMTTPWTFVFGWGPENFNAPFARHFNPLIFGWPGVAVVFDRAHNLFVEVIATMGLVGLLAYLTLFATWFWTLRQLMARTGDLKLFGVGLTALTVAYLIHLGFSFDTAAGYITFTALLALVAFLRAEAAQGKHPAVTASPAPPGWAPLSWAPLSLAQGSALLLGLIFSAGLIFQLNVRPALANLSAARASAAARADNLPRAMQHFEQAVAYNRFGVYDLRQSFAHYLLDVGEQPGAPPPGYEQALRLTIAEVEKNLSLHRYDYIPLLTLARLHMRASQQRLDAADIDAALAYAGRALRMAPRFLPAYHDIAQAYLLKDEPEQALHWLEQARALNPALGLNDWLLGVARDQLGDPQGAFTLMRTAINKGHRLWWDDNERLLAVYLRFNDISQAVERLEGLVAGHPGNASFAALLALGFERAGNDAAAVAMAQRAVTLNPSYRAGAEGLRRRVRLRELEANAHQWMRHALEVGATAGSIDWLLGTSRYQRRDVQGALDHLQRAVDRGRVLCWPDGERLFLQNTSPTDAHTAANRLTPLTEAHPESATLRPLLAFALQRAGDPAGALRTARQAAHTEPHACRNLSPAHAILQARLEAQADAWFDQAEQIETDLGGAYWLLARARHRAGDTAGAIDLARLAIQHRYRPSWLDAQWMINRYNSINEPTDAARRLERLVRRNPRQPALLALLALAYDQAGAADAAIGAARQAASLDHSYRHGAAALARRLSAPPALGEQPVARSQPLPKIQGPSGENELPPQPLR